MKRLILLVIPGLLAATLPAVGQTTPDPVPLTFLLAGKSPEGMTVNPVTHKAYVVAEVEGTGRAVLVFDGGVLNNPPTIIPIPDETEYITVDSTRNRIYLSTKFAAEEADDGPDEPIPGQGPGIKLGTLTVIDGNTDTVIAIWQFPEGVEPEGVAVDPAENIVYVGAKAPEPAIGDVEEPGDPPCAPENPPVIRPGSGQVECWTGGSIYVFNAADITTGPIKIIPAGDDPESVVFQKKKVYAANEDDGTVTIATAVRADGSGGELVTDTPVASSALPPYSLGVFYPFGENPLACADNKYEADKMAAGGGSVFITDDRSRVAIIKGDAVVGMSDVPGASQCLEIPNTDGGGANSANNIAFRQTTSGSAVYVVSEQNTVAVLDPESLAVIATITIPGAVHLDAIGVDGAANQVWITDEDLPGLFVLQGACAEGKGACALAPNTPPVIPTATSAEFITGFAGTFTVWAIGSPTPTLYELGGLPEGVTFTDNGNGSATLAGIPAAGAAGSHVFTITAWNMVLPNATQDFTLTIDAATAPVITSSNMGNFTVGSAGSFTVTATGTPMPTLWEVGALPDGVTFTDNGNGTATLAGTPAAPGIYPFTITAWNMVMPNATQDFTLTVTATRVTDDYDGDRKADLTVWNGSDGSWQVLKSSGGYADGFAKSWGSSADGDIPVPGDYDGDGLTDIAVYRPSFGGWFVLTSSSGYAYDSEIFKQWGSGADGDIPVPGDYDGDGQTDLAIWRASEGAWYVLQSSTGYDYSSALFKQWGSGALGDVPVPGDYDGDCRIDMAIWRRSEGTWFVLTSGSGYEYSSAIFKQWGSGASGEMAVPADYDGDGRTDFAVWRPSEGAWSVLTSRSGYDYADALFRQWGSGAESDVPVVSDYDGDGRADIAVWRPSAGIWFVLTSTSEYSYADAVTTPWGHGAAGDTAVREQSVRTPMQ